MIVVVPLAVGAALLVFGLMAAKKAEGEKTPDAPAPPGLPPGGPSVAPATPESAPPGELPPLSQANTGDQAVAHADDAFDHAVATAISMGAVDTLERLANEAEAKGLLTVARSIRDEIARLKNEAPKPTPAGPDKPAVTTTLATYVVKAGDTGTSIAKSYTGDGNRWKELVTVNPGSASSQYGFKANVGQRINIPASWPAGIPVVAVAPNIPPPPATTFNTYTVKSGDTGTKVATAFVGDGKRWPELLTVNPSLKSAQYGIALYTGHKINLPASWPAVPKGAAAPPPPAVIPPSPTVVPLPEMTITPTDSPQLVPPPESPARTAARDLTAYLTSIGGLAGRFKEDRKKVSAYLSAMGVPDSTGMYGRQGAGAVMQNGFVPVVPFYWPTSGATKAKTDFSNLVKSFQAADPQRSAAWSKLLTDIQRA